MEKLINELAQGDGEDVYKASDALAEIDSGEVLLALLELLKNANTDVRFLAARTLGKMKTNHTALEPLLEAINDSSNKSIAGDLLMALEGFDLSEAYVTIFKLYLFGSFKVSKVAKDLLDHKEFIITSRVIKKAQKHWNHYMNNVKHDDAFELRKEEVEEILDDLRAFIES